MNVIKLILLVIIAHSTMFGMLTIDKASICAPRDLGKLILMHEKNKFKILDEENEFQEIKNYNIDKDFRNIDQKNLKKFLSNGYISVKKRSDGEYALSFNGRVKGGGPGFGAFVYWSVKSFCWGIVGTAVAVPVTAVVVATGGTALAPVGLGGGAAVGVATKTAVVGLTASVGATTTLTGATTLGIGSLTGGMTVGTAVVSGTLGTTTATALTTSTIAATGSWIGFAGLIEAIATGAGLLCGMTPTV